MANVEIQLIFVKTKPKQTQKYAYIFLKMKTKEKFIRREHTKMITNCMPGMRKIAYTLTALSDKNKRL